jgi:uncharacterized membrane protein YobD (UPF0266 family)
MSSRVLADARVDTDGKLIQGSRGHHDIFKVKAKVVYTLLRSIGLGLRLAASYIRGRRAIFYKTSRFHGYEFLQYFGIHWMTDSQ